MEITKEAVEKRLAVLREQYEQLQANAVATNGAIQDCQYWLQELQKVDVPKEGHKLAKVE